MWFSYYRRDGQGNDSCGFEHVFVGESKGDSITGFHNWIQVRRSDRMRLSRHATARVRTGAAPTSTPHVGCHGAQRDAHPGQTGLHCAEPRSFRFPARQGEGHDLVFVLQIRMWVMR